jgi:phytanoyl-CoA hydroxylase
MSVRDYYEENGYVVFRNLVPTELIDSLLTAYAKQIVPSKYPFFRQNTNSYETNEINEFGYVKQAFLDIHDYGKFPEFSTIAKEIFCTDAIQDALRQVTRATSINLMQSMLFDANTETPPHQDWYYLDTVPNGNLIAAWIALEEIDERAGRFYVIPKSVHIDLHSNTPNLPHSKWLARMKEYVAANKNKIEAPALKKGDVLFWNSRTIHGALPTVDKRFSRKSLTAHYIPSEYKFGNLFTTKDYIRYQNYKGVKFYKNQPDYSLLNRVKFSIKQGVYDSPLLMKIFRKIQAKLGKP